VADAREAVRVCTVMNARLAARRISRFLETRLREEGLSVAQFGLMAHIAAARDDTIGALAEQTGLDQSTLSRNLHALRRDALVEIAVVEKDLRRRAVWLTEKGVRRLEAVLQIWRDSHAAISKVIDPRGVRRLADAAARLDDHLKADAAST
jgi:DNA-binding MarR family transcriptional regulator